MHAEIYFFRTHPFVFLITHIISDVKRRRFDVAPCSRLHLSGTSTDLCEDKNAEERTNYIQLHARELDHISVAFCKSCLFHVIHVC